MSVTASTGSVVTSPLRRGRPSGDRLLGLRLFFCSRVAAYDGDLVHEPVPVLFLKFSDVLEVPVKIVAKARADLPATPAHIVNNRSVAVHGGSSQFWS